MIECQLGILFGYLFRLCRFDSNAEWRPLTNMGHRECLSGRAIEGHAAENEHIAYDQCEVGSERELNAPTATDSDGEDWISSVGVH